MLLAEPLQITNRLAQEFEKLGIPYLVGGSLASSLHGIPRATNDVDMVADIKYEHISALVSALEAEFYEEMKRRGRYQISDTPDQELFIASAEDVIVQKLYWFQFGGSVSERQRAKEILSN
jgi:hypothetical protein